MLRWPLPNLLVFDRNLKRLREIQTNYLDLRVVRGCAGRPVDGQQGWTAWSSSSIGTANILGWFGKWGNNPDSNDIGEAHQLAVSRDLKTIYVADSLLAHVLKIEAN